MESLEKCEICYEEKDINQFEIFPCSHKTCKTCVKKIKNDLCPFCRMKFRQSNRSNPIDIPYSTRNVLEIPFENLIVSRSRMNSENMLADSLSLHNHYSRRVSRRRRRNRNRNRNRNISSRSLDSTYQIFDFVEGNDTQGGIEEGMEEGREEESTERQMNRNNIRQNKNTRRNRWQQLNIHTNFMNSI